jgi:triosephosphate isomerase (TIM)
MSRRRRIIAGNWKMHGRLTSGLSLANDLVQRLSSHRNLGADIVICPPYTLLWPVAEVLADSTLRLGAQDCHPENHGAYTGDVSAAMLIDMGCRYVILGHSERRNGHKEDNALVARKVAAAQQAGLTVILCVGETRAEYDAGQKTEAVWLNQLFWLSDRDTKPSAGLWQHSVGHILLTKSKQGFFRCYVRCAVLPKPGSSSC